MHLILRAGLIIPAAFANANAGSKIYISSGAMEIGSLLADFTGETWVEITGIGSLGETGAITNILNYDTWDTDTIRKAKGMTDAGSPELEVARDWNDAGQVALRAAARTNLNYGLKEVRNDPVTVGGDPTTYYNLGLITGPRRPNGRNEDFDLEVFTFALQQREIIVNPD